MKFAIVIVLLVLVSLAALHSFLPPTARDALIHHLAIPKLWVEGNKINEIVWHDWSYYPMLLQLGFTGFLSLKLTSLASLYHFSFAFLTSCVVAGFISEKTKNNRVALVSGFLLITLPIILKLSSIQLVDLGLLYYSTLAVILTITFIDKMSFLRSLAIGASLGLAMGCKYNGFLFVALFFISFLFYVARSRKSGYLVYFYYLLSGVISLLIVAPWLIKNFLYTGNPVYPLLGSMFGTAKATPGVSGFKGMELRYLQYGESAFEYLLIPLRMIFWGEDDNPKYFDGRLSPLLILCLYSLGLMRKNAWIIFSLLLTVSYTYFALFYSGPRLRYLIPILGIVVVLSGYSISEITKNMKNRSQNGIYILIVILQVVWSGYYLKGYLAETSVVNYYVKNLTDDQYLTSKVSEHKLAKYINENLSEDDIIYLYYTGNRFYYYNKKVRSSGHFGSNELIRWLHKSSDAKTLYSFYEINNVSYIAVHADRLLRSLTATLPPEKIKIWNNFYHTYLKVNKTIGPYGIWEIAP